MKLKSQDCASTRSTIRNNNDDAARMQQTAYVLACMVRSSSNVGLRNCSAKLSLIKAIYSI